MTSPSEAPPQADWIAVLDRHDPHAAVPEGLLNQAGIVWEVASSIAGLGDALARGAGTILLPGELRDTDDVHALAQLLRAQPPWSDVPVVVISDPRAGSTISPRRMIEALGNVIVLPRPLFANTFITVLHSAMRARGRQYQALNRHAEVSSDRHDFLATLAHELRNPLAPIANGLQMLRAAALPESELDVVEMLQRQTQQLVQMIDDLLLSTRLDQGPGSEGAELVDVRELVNRATAGVDTSARARNHTLSVTLPESAAFVRGDGAQLVQALSGILGRAITETSPGGQVDLVVVAEADRVVISICDNGPGLTSRQLAELRALLDNPVTAATADRGLGVALTLAQQVAVRHGGSFAVRSEGVGTGTTYDLRLPRATAETIDPARQDPATLPRVPTPVASAGPPLRALIVDDNRDAADTLGMLLRSIGLEVQVVYDGYAALDAMVTFAPVVVLLDIGMPGLSGYELAHRIRTNDPDHAILLIAQTGWGHQRDHQLSAAAGIDHHLVKPIDFVQLQHLLAARFGGVTPAPAKK